MNYRIRRLPSMEAIRKNVRSAGIPLDPESPALALAILNAASLIQQTILEPLEADGLSEGKFILLMALKSEPGGLGVQELADRAGVSVPTVSIMLKRMKSAAVPLITMERDEADARGRRIRISEAGLLLLDRILPPHLEREKQFAERLSPEDRETLVRLLSQLTESFR